MKKTIHKEILICDVCGKKVDKLNEHMVVGSHYTPSDYQGLATFVKFKDFKIEMCNDCERHLVKIVEDNFAEIYDSNYCNEVVVRKVD